MGGIKLTLDLAIGETSAIESTDKGKIQDIVKRVKDLNGRLQDIRREQVFQRVCSFHFFSSLFSRELGMGITWRFKMQWVLTASYRNVKPNSEINQNPPTRVLLDGHWSNWSFWASPAHGNSLTFGLSL